MPPSRLLLLSFSLLFAVLSPAADDYQPGPDSKPQEGVPKGDVLKFEFKSSKIFPGTVRDYWVYVPKQYTPDKPACVHVNQDGIQNLAPVVFDNLIAKKEIPVIIGVFVMHGRVPAAAPAATASTPSPRFSPPDCPSARSPRWSTRPPPPSAIPISPANPSL